MCRFSHGPAVHQQKAGVSVGGVNDAEEEVAQGHLDPQTDQNLQQQPETRVHLQD